jgi:hypothetical protein
MKKLAFILMALCLVTFLSNAQIPTNGLVGYWPFNGNANDASGNGLNGTVYSASLTTDRFGNANSAFQFSGTTSSYISVSNNAKLLLADNLTISFWIYRTRTSSVEYIVGKGRDLGNSYSFILNSAGGTYGAFRASNGTGAFNSLVTPQAVDSNKWVFLTYVIHQPDSIQKLYVNGVPVDSSKSVLFTITNNYPLVFGRHFAAANGSGGYEYPFLGKIDDILIYNRGLTQTEVLNLYHINLCPAPKPSANDVSRCLNGTVTLTATGGTNYFWYKKPYGGISIGTGSPFTTPYLTKDTVFYVANYNGTCESLRDTVVIKINPLPIIIIYPIDKKCLNGTIISLNNFVMIDGSFKTGGIWSSPSSGLVFGDKFNPIAAGVSTPPGWKVIYEYTNPNTGCYNKDSSYITIWALPKPYAGVDDTMCTGEGRRTLSGLPVIPPGDWRGTGVGGTYMAWYFDPLASGVVNGGTYPLIYHYKDNNQCENEDTVKITVFITPVVDAGTDKEVCLDGPPVTLVGNPAGGTWTGTGVVGSQFYPNVAKVGVHELTYSYTNVVCAVSDKMLVTVWPLPILSVGTKPDNRREYCRTEGLIELEGQPTGGTWSGPGVQGTFFNTAIGPDVREDFTLTYRYVDIHGCLSTMNMVLWVRPEPVVIIDPSGNRLCSGNPYTARSQYNHAEGIKWSKGSLSDGMILGNDTATQLGYNPGAGDLSRAYFWLFVKTTHSDSICAPVYDSIRVTVSPKPPTPVISLTPSDSFLECNLTNGSSYVWCYRPNMSTPRTISQISRRINPQLYCNKCYYSVVFVDSVGCASDTSATYHYIGNSVEENDHNPQLLLYPNPSSGSFNLSFNLEGIQNVSIQVINNLGQVVYDESKNNVSSNYSNRLDLSYLPNGIYILTVKIGTGTANKRISILK